MSTATEMMMLMQLAEPQLKRLQTALKGHYGVMIEDAMVRCMGREVSAKRMRTLQRRGAVIRFSRYTATGKRRYKWLPVASLAWA